MQVAAGQLLVASPSLGDPNFMRAVIYLVEHNETGTLGVIINRALDVALSELWEECPESLADRRLCCEGGPVDRHKGLLLHTRDGLAGSFHLGQGLVVGGDDRALRQAYADGPDGTGPRLFLGHAGWGEGQLERELMEGGWCLRRGDVRWVLSPDPPDDLWQCLLQSGDPTPQPSAN